MTTATLEATRAPRRDKKKEIKATIPQAIRGLLAARGQALGLSAMAYAERLTVSALTQESIIRAFCPYIRRPYIWEKRVVWVNRQNPAPVEALLPEGKAERFPVKFLSEEYELVAEIAHSLDVSLAQGLTICLTEALIQNIQVEGVKQDGKSENDL